MAATPDDYARKFEELSGQNLPDDPVDRYKHVLGIDEGIFGSIPGVIPSIGFMVGKIGDAVGGLISAITGGSGSTVSELSDYQRAQREKQIEINERTDLLSPLLDYGSAYMNTVSPFARPLTLPFSNQVGPMHGCRLSGGRIILGSKGLWDIRCQIWIGRTSLPLVSEVVNWEIRVLRPDLSLYSVTAATYKGIPALSMTNVASVVVPEEGYHVEAFLSFAHSGRPILGGPDRNRLTVQHISYDTETGDTGQ